MNDVTVHEGDIIMSDAQYNLVSHGNQNDKRTTYHHYEYLWKSKILPYEIDPNMPSATMSLIEMAVADIQAKTCLSFRKRVREKNWIRFTRQRGCWSSVGRQSYLGAQNISIGTGCDLLGIVQHEVMHALGFYHEQSRPDRDTYVSIYWENILPGQENNFVRYPKQTITTLGLQYDYESVLHYGNKFFSKNGRPTILATTMPLITLGQRNGMSKLDYAKINVLYDCKFHQPDSWSQWSPFSPCDELCRKKRQRFCYSDHPGRCDDASSSGLQTRVVQCSFEECYAPVDGHWSRWSRFTACSSSCGIGFHRRVRLCNDPHPAYGGNDCIGKSWELRNCRLRLCNLGPYDCDFTDNTCGWRQSSFDDFEWARTSEGTPSRNTGPDWDHTGLIEGVEESHGHFMYIEASGKPAGYHAKLESPVFQDLDGRDSISNCLSFYYNMYGLGMGQLNIYLVFIDGRQELLWKTSGNHGKAWHHGIFTFTSFSTYKIVFEAVRGDGYTSDVAIDDVSVVRNGCAELSKKSKKARSANTP